MGVNTHNFHSPILEKSRGKILLFVLFLFIGAQFPGSDSNSSGPNSNSTFAHGQCLLPTYICCSRPLLRIVRTYLHNRAYLRIYRNGLFSCEYTRRIHGYIIGQIYWAHLRTFRALVQTCRVLLWIYRAHLRMHRSLLRIYRAHLRICRVLVQMYRALLRIYRAHLRIRRSLLRIYLGLICRYMRLVHSVVCR